MTAGNGATPDLRLTVQQGVAYHALQRTIAVLRGDAKMLQQIGETEIAQAFLGMASIAEGSCDKYLAATQRTIIPAGGLLVGR